MWTTADTTQALVKARNTNTTLAGRKQGTGVKAEEGKPLAGLLEALSAVIPSGIVTVYTAVALPLQEFAEKQGSSDRAASAVSMAKAGKSQHALDEWLARAPPEADDLLVLRWLVVLAALLAVLATVGKAASDANQENKRGPVVAEPAAAVLAFITWALAAPGTPLGALVDSDQAGSVSLGIAGIGVLLLMALGGTYLVKPTKTAKSSPDA